MMKVRFFVFLFIVAGLALTRLAAAGQDFFQAGEALPFSFVYEGRAYSGKFPENWAGERRAKGLDGGCSQETFVWRDAETGLEVRCEAVAYEDFGATEWVLYLSNASDNETPVIEEIRVADFEWDGGVAPFTLYYAEGSHEKITDFQPMHKVLEQGVVSRFRPFGGRPSDGFLPFFNIAGRSGGLVVAIGWTGQWQASFTRRGGRVGVCAGMETAHFKLEPGERVRMPSVLVLPWTGEDRMAGQNKFRRFLLEHVVPRYEGAPAGPLTAASPHAAVPFEKTTETNMIEAIQNIAAHKLPVDYFWIDAGWYTSPDGNWARGVGNFEADPARFPRGLKPVADAAHGAGMKFLLWFEPERVMPGTFLYERHPDWLLKPPEKFPPGLEYHFKSGFHLLNLGTPAALSWVTGTVSHKIDEVGIDAYRNDFNMSPSFYWRRDEPADRQGIREIRYVEGLYAYLDALREGRPSLLIDTCASGGRRIDLEMMRRALVLTRSDYLWDPTGQQCHTFGLAQWLPLTGIGAAETDVYKCRSGYGTHFVLAVDWYSDDESVWAAARARLEECRSLAPMFRKDFYALTPYSTGNDAWMVWQYHDAAQQAGLVQAFRREDCEADSVCCTLRGLDAASAYDVGNLDTNKTVQFSGGDLLNAGLTVKLPEKPASAIFTYQERR